MAVAAAVAAGRADAGLGIRAAAQAFGLDFVPVAWEPYDLVLRVAGAGGSTCWPRCGTSWPGPISNCKWSSSAATPVGRWAAGSGDTPASPAPHLNDPSGEPARDVHAEVAGGRSQFSKLGDGHVDRPRLLLGPPDPL